MNHNALKATLHRGPAPTRMAETKVLCRGLLEAAEPRTGFWQFLSNIFPYVGLRLWVLQGAVLLLLCTEALTPQRLSFYAPLLVLVCLPSLYESRIYTTTELEVATRASAAQLLLGKLVLAGAANLVGLTLSIALQSRGAEGGLLPLILYALVPFLCCTSATLWSLRTCRPRAEWLSVVLCVALSVFFNLAARQLPGLYTRSATGLWGLTFVLFSAFFGKELLMLVNRYRKGRIYGTVDT